MRNYCRVLAVVVFVVISIPLYTFNLAAHPADLGDNKEQENFVIHFDILEDPSGQWHIDDIISDKVSNLFQPSKDISLALGHTASIYWIRFTLVNTPDSKIRWILKQKYPVMDYVDFYIPNMDGGYTIKKSGDKYPFDIREIDHADIIFSIPLSDEVENTYYLRYQTGGSMNISLQLFSAKSFIRENSKELLITGIYYGILLALLLYNLFVFVGTQDRGYLYYVLYMTAMVLYQSIARGIGYQYFWPDKPEWTDSSLLFSLCLSVFFLLQFIRSFLNLHQISPLINKITMFLMSLYLVALVCTVLLPYTLVMSAVNWLILASILNLIVTFVYGLKKRFHPTRFLVIAFSMLIIGTALKILKDIGILPYVFITEYGTQLGTAFEAIILSLALAYRINTLQKEKRTALAEVYNTQQKLVKSQMQAIENLEQSETIKDEFIANITHELRTPMHHIISYAQIGLNKYDVSKEKTRESIEKILSASSRMMVLVDNLFNLSKLEGRKIDFTFSEIDIRSIVNETIVGLTDQLEEKKISILMEEPLVPTKIICDHVAIKQVIGNLLSNAIHFSSLNKSISISLNSVGSSLCVIIKDEGPGIPEGELELIFDRFSQSTKTKTGAGGRGLGLAICRKIVEAHTGKIWAENNPDGGSTFSFMLPYKRKGV